MASSLGIWPGVWVGLLLGCSSVAGLDSDERIPLDRDLREYARQARVNLARLTAEQRARIEPILSEHEQAISHYDRLMARGNTRRAVQAPLFATGAALVADDASGAGIADDIALPFLAVGLVAAHLVTSAPAGSGERRQAYDRVVNTGQAVSMAMDKLLGASDTQSAYEYEPGTREYCIERYVDCQQNARRGFSTRRCQPCMDRCMGGGYEWPPEGCDYL